MTSTTQPAASTSGQPEDSTFRLDIAGTWRLLLDPSDVGERERWFDGLPGEEPQHLELPGSLQEQGFGDEVSLKTPWTGLVVDRSFFTDERYARYREPGEVSVPFWLQPRRYYRGAAWFQRDLDSRGVGGPALVLALERRTGVDPLAGRPRDRLDAASRPPTIRPRRTGTGRHGSRSASTTAPSRHRPELPQHLRPHPGQLERLIGAIDPAARPAGRGPHIVTTIRCRRRRSRGWTRHTAPRCRRASSPRTVTGTVEHPSPPVPFHRDPRSSTGAARRDGHSYVDSRSTSAHLGRVGAGSTRPTVDLRHSRRRPRPPPTMSTASGCGRCARRYAADGQWSPAFIRGTLDSAAFRALAIRPRMSQPGVDFQHYRAHGLNRCASIPGARRRRFAAAGRGGLLSPCRGTVWANQGAPRRRPPGRRLITRRPARSCAITAPPIVDHDLSATSPVARRGVLGRLGRPRRPTPATCDRRRRLAACRERLARPRPAISIGAEGLPPASTAGRRRRSRLPRLGQAARAPDQPRDRPVVRVSQFRRDPEVHRPHGARNFDIFPDFLAAGVAAVPRFLLASGRLRRSATRRTSSPRSAPPALAASTCWG